MSDINSLDEKLNSLQSQVRYLNIRVSPFSRPFIPSQPVEIGAVKDTATEYAKAGGTAADSYDLFTKLYLFIKDTRGEDEAADFGFVAGKSDPSKFPGIIVRYLSSGCPANFWPNMVWDLNNMCPTKVLSDTDKLIKAIADNPSRNSSRRKHYNNFNKGFDKTPFVKREFVKKE